MVYSYLGEQSGLVLRFGGKVQGRGLYEFGVFLGLKCNRYYPVPGTLDRHNVGGGAVHTKYSGGLPVVPVCARQGHRHYSEAPALL